MSGGPKCAGVASGSLRGTAETSAGIKKPAMKKIMVDAELDQSTTID